MRKPIRKKLTSRKNWSEIEPVPKLDAFLTSWKPFAKLACFDDILNKKQETLKTQLTLPTHLPLPNEGQFNDRLKGLEKSIY